MDRVHELRKHISREQFGIEIGPYHSPIVPPSAGFRSVSLDVFDSDDLRNQAASDPNIPAESIANIGDVDLVGSAVDIATLVEDRYGSRQFDYILSSHNLEHIPNPIRFLQGCERVLSPGGVISMAVPDRRYCFDFYRPVTDLSEWLEAFHTQRRQPTPSQIFRGEILHSTLHGVGAWMPGDTGTPEPASNLSSAYARWQESLRTGAVKYVDAHCSAFTPASLELMMADLRHLGLTGLQPLEISQPNGCEFYVHLGFADTVAEDAPAFHRRRAEIMKRAADELVDWSVPRGRFADIRSQQRVLRAKSAAFAKQHQGTAYAYCALRSARDRFRDSRRRRTSV
jgi:hypothetical protein